MFTLRSALRASQGLPTLHPGRWRNFNARSDPDIVRVAGHPIASVAPGSRQVTA
jgi:hypothetical protein